MLFPSMPIKVCLQEVLATLVTVEEAPVKVLKEIATTAMAKVPQLVGVTWSKEPLRWFLFGNLLGYLPSEKNSINNN